ncbi:MAG: APC family permease [Defluviitaleaceae bacterium]|nr:APC family permease [Defluviitaleaceae bacterium]
MQALKRQHGLFVTTCFVVGFLVGTGIFFLPGRILYEVDGNVGLGVMAWVIGGLMIAPCVFMFSQFAARYEKMHGFVDYAEAIVGRRYGYLAGWFFAVMYQPAGYAIIAWITSGFTATLVGMEPGSEVYLPFRFFISGFFMAVTFVVNYLAPKVPVKFNVVTTVARMIPLVLMGTVGVLIGLVVNRSHQPEVIETLNLLGNARGYTSLFAAISATAFAFNGWQAALAFNTEVKDSKRKFPIALMGGFGLVIVVYVLYFIGITHASPESTALIMQGGGANFAQGTRHAFEYIFGRAGGWLVIFMIISGLGILNACCLGMSRAMYALAKRNTGPMHDRMSELDAKTNVPNNSMFMAVGIGYVWLFVIFSNTMEWFGSFSFSLPDFYNYSFFGLLVPIFVCYAIRQKDLHFVKRIIFPVVATAGAAFMFTTYWLGSTRHAIVYSVTFICLALVGWIWYKDTPISADINIAGAQNE